MDLVGVYVHCGDKAGRDAGELCGAGPHRRRSPPTTPRTIAALGADCVLYMPQGCDTDALSAAAVDGGERRHHPGRVPPPGSMDPGVRRRSRRCMPSWSGSIHSTGSSPGFISEAIPLVLSSMQRRLDAPRSSTSSPTSPGALTRAALRPDGLRPLSPTNFDPRRWAHGAASFGPSLRLVAEALGLPLDSVEAQRRGGRGPADDHHRGRDHRGRDGGRPADDVSGLRAGRPLLQFRSNWYCTDDLDPAWELRPTGWRVVVDGDTPLDVDLRLDVPIERMGELSPNFTANRAVNAVRPSAPPPGHPHQRRAAPDRPILGT